jgi:4-amino-4-deoxy-L-arabinose transferase-like glycosyltransferase
VKFPLRAAAAVLVIGLAVHVLLSALSTRWGYIPDHFDQISFGLTAREHGLLDVYSLEKEQNAWVDGQVYVNGAFTSLRRQGFHRLNYPPLYVVIRYLQVRVLKALDPAVTANTFGARLVMSSAAVAADLVLAVGVMLLAWHLFGRRAGLIAGAISWLFPPFAMNASFWDQVDAFFLAPMVFLIFSMLRRRWVWAGLCLALGALLKPQGILLVPLVLFGAAVVEEKEGRPWLSAAAARLGKVFGTALLAVIVLTLPWLLTSGPLWLERTYGTSYLEAFPYTTLKAFNIWYIDVLRLDGRPVFSPLDSRATLPGGMSKDAWGRLLTLAALAGAAVLCWKRWRREPAAVVLFSALWLWSVYVWPTRVHERFILYCMPLIIVLSAGYRRFWPAVAALALLGIAAQTHNLWLQVPAGSFEKQSVERYYDILSAGWRNAAASTPGFNTPPPTLEDAARRYFEQYRRLRPPFEIREIIVTIFSLLSYLWMVAAAAWGDPQSSSTSPKKTGLLFSTERPS